MPRKFTTSVGLQIHSAGAMHSAPVHGEGMRRTVKRNGTGFRGSDERKIYVQVV